MIFSHHQTFLLNGVLREARMFVEFGAGAALFARSPTKAEFTSERNRHGDEGAGEGAGHVEVVEPQRLGCVGLLGELGNALLALEHGRHARHGGARFWRVLRAQERDSYHSLHLLIDAVPLV